MAKTGRLTIRKLADKTAGERVARFDPDTGERLLVNPETGEPEPWPLAGIQVVDAPKAADVNTSFVNAGVAEGWLTVEGEEIVHRPGGPPQEPWRVTHTFRHGTALVLHTVDGDVRYRIVDNPDKWPEQKNSRDEGFGGEVRWFYRVKLDG